MQTSASGNQGTVRRSSVSAAKLQPNEIETDVALVRRLLVVQFSNWADRPIAPVPSAGTDNALSRLGEGMVVRLPRIHWAVGLVEKEQRWLPVLAPQLPLPVPLPLAQGPHLPPATPGRGRPPAGSTVRMRPSSLSLTRVTWRATWRGSSPHSTGPTPLVDRTPDQRISPGVSPSSRVTPPPAPPLPRWTRGEHSRPTP